jgi:hypothetical protein
MDRGRGIDYDGDAGDGRGRREAEEWLTGSKTLKIDDVREVQDLVMSLSGYELAAEVGWILRPLIYGTLRVVFMR